MKNRQVAVIRELTRELPWKCYKIHIKPSIGDCSQVANPERFPAQEWRCDIVGFAFIARWAAARVQAIEQQDYIINWELDARIPLYILTKAGKDFVLYSRLCAADSCDGAAVAAVAKTSTNSLALSNRRWRIQRQNRVSPILLACNRPIVENQLQCSRDDVVVEEAMFLAVDDVRRRKIDVRKK